MAVFRKRCGIFTACGGDVPKVRDLRTVSLNSDGVEVQTLVLDDVSEDDFLRRHPVIMEEVSLQQMLAAGVNVKEVGCGGLLDSKDTLDYSVNEDAENRVLETLEKEIEKKKK